MEQISSSSRLYFYIYYIRSGAARIVESTKSALRLYLVGVKESMLIGKHCSFALYSIYLYAGGQLLIFKKIF